MEKHQVNLTQESFELVQQDAKIHDKAFDTKPTTFFKDAIKRFCKNKSSIVAFGIIGILVLLAIFLPAISNKNIEHVSADEAFLAPKLFKSGTGFWDGTRKYTNIILDESTMSPAEFYAPGVTKLEIVGESYINATNKYGSGGYVVLYNEKISNVNSYSYPTLMTSTGNYKVNIKLHDLENYNEYELGEYAIYLVTFTLDKDGQATSTIDKKIELQGFSKNYNAVSFDLSETLADNGIESAQAAVYFEIKPATSKAKSYIMLETVKFSADETVENYDELVSKISMNDANESLLYKLDEYGKKPVGYWTATATQNAYHVRTVLCNFTYDTYVKPYSDQEMSFAYSELKDLKDKGYCTFEESKVKNADGYYEIYIDSFEVLNEKKCPIIEIISVQYNSKTGRPLTLTCYAHKYLTYKHGTQKNTYSSAPKFLFGTDNQGYDVLKRSFAGLRTSLILGVCTAAFCFVFGLVWGSISGYFGGTVDLLMERFCDILGGVPSTIVLTIAILKFGNNFLTFFLALCMTGWMGTAGRTRTQFYRYKGREYVLASRTLGSSDMRLIFKHILPNSMGTIITGSVLMITSVIYSEATLAYLNLGLQGLPSFGVMMSDNQQYLKSYSYLVLEPAVIISLMMISFNLFGNGLRDAFNPSLKGSE